MRTLLAALTIAAVLTTAVSASAYCQKSTCREEKGKPKACTYDEDDCISNGAGIVWPTHPIVPYHFHSGGSEQFDDGRMRAAVRRAFSVWTFVSCKGGRTSLRFEEGADLDDKPSRGEEAPHNYGIYFRDDSWPDVPSSLAVSRVDTLDKTGRITGANIEINSFGKEFRLSATDPGDYDLQAVVTHEVGHYLGLDHSNAVGSIMNTEYCNAQRPCLKTAEQLRTLGADDEAAVCALYPHAASPTPEDKTTCATASHGRPDLWPWLALVPLAIAIRRRRHARHAA